MDNKIKEAITCLTKGGILKPKNIEPYSFGNIDQCKKHIKDISVFYDKTIKTFHFLPEYDAVADYLSDTKGKGLFLSGDVGRGKSLIIEYVIPVLFFAKRKVVKVYHANDLGKKFDEIREKKFISIDDVGTEGVYKNYGSETEAFADVVAFAEKYNRVLFITTNLSKEQFISRYGIRIIDRLKQMCHFVKFEGKSLR